MSSELERRLEGVLAEAPEPDPGAREEALHRALRALRPVAAPKRGLRAASLIQIGRALVWFQLGRDLKHGLNLLPALRRHLYELPNPLA